MASTRLVPPEIISLPRKIAAKPMSWKWVYLLSFDGWNPIALASDTCGLAALLAHINDEHELTGAAAELWLYRRTDQRTAQRYAEIVTTELGGVLATHVYWQSGLDPRVVAEFRADALRERTLVHHDFPERAEDAAR